MLSSVIKPRWRREQDTRWTLAAALLGATAVCVAAIALLARETSTPWQPMLVVAAFAHQLLWAAPVGVALFALARRWYAFVAAGMVLLLAVLTQAPLYVADDRSARGTALTLLQANLRVGSANPASLVATVTSRHVDILMTEELTNSERDRLLSAGLAQRLPYRFLVPLADGGGGLGIWSRFPLQNKRDNPGFELGVLSARVLVAPDRPVNVFAVHLLPPYPYVSRKWVREIGRLRGVLARPAPLNRPIIVAGDFNATVDHAQFRALLTHGYQDAAEQCGAGYLASYPTDRWFPPMIAIDHVLTKRATAMSASTVSMPGSDHRALLVHVRLRS
jgi:endonuclease/exonuclease/phosphatase (EEP) superfamily protein YafD